MSREISDSKAYKQVFSPKKVRIEALKCALEIRQFEIELYWKRTAYFWTLIAATFAGYFLLQSKDSADLKPYVFLVCCIGLVMSTSWYLVNRGSKYWQENWERHVDALEDEVMGPLYKTTIHRNEYALLKVWKGYPYSVSTINQITSIFITLIWTGMAVDSFPFLSNTICDFECSQYVLGGFTLLTVLLLLILGRTGKQDKKRPVHFFKTDTI